MDPSCVPRSPRPPFAGARLFYFSLFLIALVGGVALILACTGIVPTFVALFGLGLPFAWFFAYCSDLNVPILRALVRRFEFWWFEVREADREECVVLHCALNAFAVWVSEWKS